ncbi:eukaryotic rRNA processing protein EBP2-domain-containing protein [Lipomyces starkeyi]|uniref:Uncharacterized protein n=1 Tax=Lipomyces starkeyi NRRL Y-11557 TaxID=675824 RepID=A0A1E3QHE8_LIPST|nr:hypothetical protein LIPSTDRAFT_67323 [Lipomyces starkeyi NRRL Y-11557]
MVSKLKVALDRHRGVDHEAMRLKAQHKQQEKENVKKGANKKPRLNFQGPKNKVVTVTKKGKNPNKVPAKVIEEDEDHSEDEKEDEEEDEEFEDVDSDGEAEDDYDEDDDEDDEGAEYTLPIIDTSKLEDDLSTDSESDEEEDIVRKAPPKKNEMKRVIEEEEEEEEEEEDIALSDLPTDSESEDKDDDVVDVIPHQKLTVNNVKALKHSLSTIALPIFSSFNDHMTVISDEPTTVEDANNDLTRELAFYNQALAAVTKGRSALLKEKVPFSRPEDYFAEMVKSDSHMEKLARHHSSDRSSITKGNNKNSSKGKNKKRK